MVVQVLFRGKRVIMVQFLKGMLGEGGVKRSVGVSSGSQNSSRFEHSKERFEDLPGRSGSTRGTDEHAKRLQFPKVDDDR